MSSNTPLANSATDEPGDKARQIAQVVADCLRRRAAGERLDDRELLAGHDNLLPELANELRRLRLIAAPRETGEKETMVLRQDQRNATEGVPYSDGATKGVPVPYSDGATKGVPVPYRDGATAGVPIRDTTDGRTSQDRAPAGHSAGFSFDEDESQGHERHGVAGEPVEMGVSRVGSRGLRIRCPHCHEPLEIVADASLVDIPCRACGNRFNLAGDDRAPGPLGQIGHFELLERIGMGGFGTVWKARDTKLGRTVAVKIPRKGKLGSSEVEEFLREARIAAQLKHPHIVSVHEIGRDGESVYIVSDFVRGLSLTDWRRKERLSLVESARLCGTIAATLHYAHQAGVVHRDLKPQNIMLDDQGGPHVMDFGLAKRDAEDVTMTAEGDILGTPAYMSPEQAQGKARTADRRSDVYSLGVILFEMVTDELPFRGNALNLIRQAIQDEPPRPSRLNSTVPRDLETICLKCLEKEPARRYATAQDLADELSRFCHGEPVQARPLGTLGRTWRWARRHPLVPALSASLALVVLVAYFVGWIYFEAACRRLDAELTSRALAGNKFTAASVAETAGRDFTRRFEAVERAARDPELADLMASLYGDEAFRALARQIDEPQTDAATRAQLREKILNDPRQIKLQAWTQTQTARHGLSPFAWFVTGPDGLQLSRDPLEGGETIGRNYSWRSYYHGGDSDQAQDWRPANGERLTRTHLSSVFVSQFTDQWVVVVSAPIERDGTYLGTAALMIELGKFAELPGNEADQNGRASRFAVLVDSRPGNAGQILQHPLYMHSDAVHRRALLDRSHEPRYAANLPDGQPRDDYRDPFAAEHPEYAQRWLAAAAPVKARGQETGLVVLVQESYDELLGQAVGHLKRTLLWLSLATIGLVVALVAPLWSLVLRVIR